MAITDITLNAITDPAELEQLRAMPQFHDLPDDLLFKLARHVTIFRIPDRWVAIRLILALRLPIPLK